MTGNGPGGSGLLQTLPGSDSQLDARHLRCPMPLLKTRQALRALAPGQTLLVRATDVGARRDIPAYLRQSGHELVRSSDPATETDDEIWFLIRVVDNDAETDAEGDN
ncbi:MAG: sulfurtransferase TusA family protein [Alcanivorax sp.]|nr:sulfurtransferase TusA family protein [Alcanivorax sp.]